ncbi:MAG: helix-turn-helix transcriptional regulator [Oscillospiraceae bacterium]|nr:helix-turn-helix transcriptional regulator [Oscillospiraceae bacterium]
MDVLQRLRQLSKERNWSPYILAKKCDMPQSTINNIFMRDTIPSIPTLEIICKGFGITLSQFFAENETVELSPELKELFDGWLTLTPEQKEAVTRLVHTMNKDE